MTETVRRRSRTGARLLAGVSLAALAWGQAAAGPQGGTVSHGAATITREGPVTTIDQTTPRASLNWESFDVGAGEAVRFRQPDARAIALNRIGGAEPSRIEGSLTANGQVWLLNPQGVIFGEGSRVETAGLLATTARISDADFAAGRGAFDADGEGAIVNRGTIETGEGGVVLVAPRVENAGRIASAGGDVQLHAGRAFTVDFAGDGLLSYVVEDGPVAVALENTGTIAAEGGAVRLTAAEAASVEQGVVSVGGLVEATGFAVEDGRIVVTGPGQVEVTGTLDAARGPAGGEVEVNGARVAIRSGAVLDASGPEGGGRVDVGGMKSPLPARRVLVERDATLSADATVAGPGGEVIVWSEEATGFYGALSAKGMGADGQPGGFAEISSRGALGFSGMADLSSESGGQGTLLFDPVGITVVSGGLDNALVADGEILINDEPGQFLTIDGDALTLLGADIVLEATDFVSLEDDFLLDGQNLTVVAGTLISVFGDVEVRNADATLISFETVEVRRGSVAGLPSDGSITVNNGNLSIDAVGDIFIYGDLLAEVISLNAQNGTLVIAPEPLAGGVPAPRIEADGFLASATDFAIGPVGLLEAPQARFTFNGSGAVGNGISTSGPYLSLGELHQGRFTDIAVVALGDLTVGEIGWNPSQAVPAGAAVVLTATGEVRILSEVIGTNLNTATGVFNATPGAFRLEIGEGSPFVVDEGPTFSAVRPTLVNMAADGRIGVAVVDGSEIRSAPQGLGFYVDGDVTLNPAVGQSGVILAANGVTEIDVTGDFVQRNTAQPGGTGELVNGFPGAGADLASVLVFDAASLELYGTIGGQGGVDARKGVTAAFGFSFSDVHQVNDCAIAAIRCGAPPAPLDDLVETPADTEIDIAVLANDDPGAPGVTLTIVAINGEPVTPGQTVDLTGGGTLTVNDDGTVTFDPAGEFDQLGENQLASQTLTYEIGDGTGETFVARLTIQVRGVIVVTPPVIVDDIASTRADEPVLIDPLANDTPGSGGALSVVEIDGQPVQPGQTVDVAAGGTLTLNADGTLTFDPAQDFDALGSTDTAVVAVALTYADAAGSVFDGALSIQVAGLDAVIVPVPADDLVATPADTAVAFDPLANDDPGTLGPLTLVALDGTPVAPGDVIALPGGGTLTVNQDGTLFFDPAGDFVPVPEGVVAGQSVTYSVVDADGNVLTALVGIEVRGLNDPPVAVDDAVATDGPVQVTLDILANDADPDGDPLAVLDLGGSGGLSFPGSAGGLFVYDPGAFLFFDPLTDFADIAAGTEVTTGVSYRVGDPLGLTATGFASVTVRGIEQPVEPPVEPPVVADQGALALSARLVEPQVLDEAVVTPDVEALSGFFQDIAIIQPVLEEDDPVTNRGDDEEWER